MTMFKEPNGILVGIPFEDPRRTLRGLDRAGTMPEAIDDRAQGPVATRPQHVPIARERLAGRRLAGDAPFDARLPKRFHCRIVAVVPPPKFESISNPSTSGDAGRTVP